LPETVRLAEKGGVEFGMVLIIFAKPRDHLPGDFHYQQSCALIPELPANYPRDPADRIIGATALAEGLTLITADRNILASKAVQTAW